MSKFELRVTPDIEIDVKAKVPTGAKNGWRTISFTARFEPMTQDEMKAEKVTVAQAMERSLRTVDFGSIEVVNEDRAGNSLTNEQVALGNVYTYNALLAAYRDNVLAMNAEGKA